MPIFHHWFKATNDDGTDITLDLLRFSEVIGLERIIPSRYSLLLLLALYGGTQSGRLNPAKVMHEIESLEDISKKSRLKPASIFKHAPLRGLWHKHYMEDGLSSMSKNLRKGISKFGLPWLEQQIIETQASGVEKCISEADCAQIAHDAVIGNWERLIGRSALTGEWLIFAIYQEKNYYLCLGRHADGDDILRSQIDTVCLKEFPFLADILS